MTKKRILSTLAAGLALACDAGAADLDTAAIEKAMGAKGTANEAEGVFKVAFPRTDVGVKVDGNPFPPFMGLTSWAAFQKGTKSEAMVMGDLVLFEDEVNPVMSAALDGGLTVTALHNHFFFDEPKVYFMHIGGEGGTEALANGVRGAFDVVKRVRAARAEPATAFGSGPAVLSGPSRVSAEPIEKAFGVKASVKDGMVKIVLGRTARASCGCDVGKEMGVNTWAAFAGDDERAIVCGDFVCFPGELQPALKALRAGGINVVTIHNHMEDESPRLIFLHYWATGKPADLAKKLKAAADVM